MKKTTILIISLTLMVLSIPNKVFAADFTTGNLVVLRIGDGSASLSSAATASFIDEYTPAGTLVQTIANPTSGDNMIANSGSATSEGALSFNRTHITFAGYNAALGTASINGTTSAATNRIILSYDKTLNITSSKSATAYSANNIRSAVRNGNDFWAGGTSSGAGTNGVQYFGTGTAGQVSATMTNVRVVNIFNGQLYFTTGSSTVGIYKVGSDLPTGTGVTSTLEIGTTYGTGTASPYGFSFNSTSTICYVADDRTSANGGGILKFTKTGETWVYAYTLSLGIGARGLAVDWSATNPIIYATTTDNKIAKIEDSGASAVSLVLVTGATNTAFRGIGFTPDLNTSTQTPKSQTWTLANNTLSFTDLPGSKIEVYTLTGSKAAIFEPSINVNLNLSKGVYILKVDNNTSKIMLK